MIIVAGIRTRGRHGQDTQVAASSDLVSRAREFDPCVHVAITADSVNPEQVNSVEVWPDAEVLTKWRAMAPRTKKPKQSAARRYDVTDGGPLFCDGPVRTAALPGLILSPGRVARVGAR